MRVRSSLSVNIRSSLATLNVHSTAEQRNAKGVLQNSIQQNVGIKIWSKSLMIRGLCRNTV